MDARRLADVQGTYFIGAPEMLRQMAEGAPPPKSGMKSFLDKLDTRVDAALNRTFDPTKPVLATQETKRAGRFALGKVKKGSKPAGKAARQISRLERRGRLYLIDLALMEGRRSPVERVVRHPKLVIATCILVSILLTLPAVFIFGAPQLGIKSGMRADLEVFLPQDDPATQILGQIRQNYSTDPCIAVFDLYVPGGNITDYQWLKQISDFEGDVAARGEDGEVSGVNWRLDDIGAIDGVNWSLSVSAIVKTVNVTGSNFLHALSAIYGWPPESTIPNATYSLPSDQSSIDSVVNDIDPSQRSSLIVNRQGDANGTYNRLVVLFGLSKDLSQQAAVIQRAERLAALLNSDNGGNLVVRITGPVIVFRDLQQGVSKELFRAMPFIIGGLVGVLYYWHRNWRVLVLTLLPVLLASGIAYGVTGLAHQLAPNTVILAPQVVLAAPMLLSIGVSYGLYIINRYVEEVGETREERISHAVVRINPAIFLSAVATGIGFFALMIGTLPPIWTLGLALTIGITFTYIFTYALIPALLVVLGYDKKVSFHEWKRVSDIPVKRKGAIILISFMVVGASLGVLLAGKISFDVDYLTMTPAGSPSVEAMRDYSNTMGGGQMGLVLARGNFNHVATLDELDRAQTGISGFKEVQTISIVTVMKLVRSPDAVVIGGTNVSLPANLTLWDIIHSTSDANAQVMLALFYQSVPVELRSMLVDPQLKSAVVYLLMPFLSIDKTREIVTGINGYIDEGERSRTNTQILHMAGIQTVTLAVNDLIIEGQIISLCVALFLTFMHIWLVFGDLRVALLTMVPVSMVSLMEPLILVLLNIPLSTVTVMIGSIAIGTGVDFAVNITQRMRLEGYTMKSITNAVEKAGVSFVEATSTMVMGFAGMFAMNIVSIQQFVFMIIILLVLNMVMAMFLFPSLAIIWVNKRKHPPPPEGIYVVWMKKVRKNLMAPRPVPRPPAGVAEAHEVVIAGSAAE